MEKTCFSANKLILTSERRAEHTFAGQNTQQLWLKNFRKLEKDLLRIEEVDEDEKTEDKSSSVVTSPDGNYCVTSFKENINNPIQTQIVT